MKSALALALFVLPLAPQFASADAVAFVSHRAAYAITMASGSSRGANSQAPTGASGLIGYEFRGSPCEGYVSNFRQVTQLQQAEGEPIATDSRSLVYEDGQAKTLRFEIDGTTGDKSDPPVRGAAARDANGDITVDLTKPTTEKADIGPQILFPTQHLMHVIEAAKAGQKTLQARVFDGSDTGKKVYDTLTVIGAENANFGPEPAKAQELATVKHWPVAISYFDATKKDSAPEYILYFALYQNGVPGHLKLDYGAFALAGELTSLEILPTAACKP